MVPPSLIKDEQLLLLLARMMVSFEKGDLSKFVGLFADGAQTSHASGKREIRDYYRSYFARPEQRKLSISGLEWVDQGTHGKTGRGDMQLSLIPLEAGASVQYIGGEIVLSVSLVNQKLKIDRLYYQDVAK